MRLFIVAATFTLSLLFGGVAAVEQPQLQPPSPVLAGTAQGSAPIYEMFASSAVQVRAVINQPGKGEAVKASSGFCISDQGVILTTASAVDQAQELWAAHTSALGTKLYKADLIASDDRSNIALLKLENKPKEMGVIKLDPAAPKVRIGNSVVALSRPLYFATTPRTLEIGGLDGHFERHMFPTHYWRLNGPMLFGEEGGAVFTQEGHYLGMITNGVPEFFSTYVMPVASVAKICEELLANEKVEYGRLGVQVDPVLSPQNVYTVIVSSVDENSPAGAAGLSKGDEVISIGQHLIQNIDDVRSAAFELRANQTCLIRVKKENGSPAEYVVRVLEA